jgi:hypothetical protein
MDVHEALSEAGVAMTAKRVYAEPYVHDGLTIIPAAAVRGGGGGGGDASSGGAGFGLYATPKGAWVVEGEKVTWKPAVDVNRIVLGGQLVAIAALLTGRRIANIWAPKRRARQPLLRVARRELRITRHGRHQPAHRLGRIRSRH